MVGTIAACRTARIGPNILLIGGLQPAICEAAARELRERDDWTESRIVRSETATGRHPCVDTADRCSFSLPDLQCNGVWTPTLAALQAALTVAAEQEWRLMNCGYSQAEVVRYDVGGFFRPHRDHVGRNDPRLLTAVMFLNDDYGGGRLRFHLRNLFDVEPEAGKVIVFPADYVHESTPVFRGQKFIVVQCLLRRSSGGGRQAPELA